MPDKVWMEPPSGGAPKEVDATPAILVPLMVQGWRQAKPPAGNTPEEVKADAS